MRLFTRRNLLSASALGTMVLSTIALAGFKYTPSISVTGSYASGVPAAVRADGAPIDTIGCQTWVDATGAHGACHAQVPNLSVACSTVDAEMITQIRSLQSDQSISFSWNPHTGVCTTVSGSLSSMYPPKTP